MYIDKKFILTLFKIQNAFDAGDLKIFSSHRNLVIDYFFFLPQTSRRLLSHASDVYLVAIKLILINKYIDNGTFRHRHSID